MFKDKILKSLNKGIFVTLLSSVALLPFFSVESNATSTYYIRTLFDEGNFGVISQVISDKGDTGDYVERAQGVDFSAIADYRKVYKGGNGSAPGSKLIANIVDTDGNVNDVYKEVLNNSDKNMGLVFSFPGLVEDSDIKYKALSSDMERAELVSNTLSKGLNDALAFIKTYTGKEHISGEGLRHVLAQLARITAQFENGASSGTFNSGADANRKGFSIIQVTGATQEINGAKASVGDELIPVNGLRYSDYVAISTTNSDGQIVYGYYPWRMAKGYHPGQALANIVGESYSGKSYEKENRYITWGQLIIQAGVNADVRGSSIVDSASDIMTLIGQGLGSDLTSTITSVRSMLNLAPIQELILNMGARSATHHYGVMTAEMYDTAKTVYVLVLVVSLLFLSVLIVKMIHQKMISTTNIIAKTSLMEGLQDIIFVGAMLAFFPSIFEILLELNYWIVKTFSFSSEYLTAYGISTSKVLSTESLAGFIVSSMFLSIDVYINTTYLVRAIVVSFLFAISPVLTVSYCWGATQKKLYFSYMRELVGNIFMQSFHAITMTFFAGYNTTNMSAMEAIASAYCFIPITQLFRQLVIGSQGGFSESLGGKLAGQLTNTAMGAHKSAVSMKQSKQLMDLQAENTKNMSSANMWSQGAAMLGDVASMTLSSNIAGEIGSNAIAGIANKASKSNSSLLSGAGKTVNNFSNSNKGAIAGSIGKAALGAGSSALGNIAAGKLSENASLNANNKLGEMQMKHSMENMGVSLAQAGAGLGISSFEGAAGNAMVNAGMSGFEKAAGEYGRGDSNAGIGGSLLAEAKGIDARAESMRSSVIINSRAMGNNFGAARDTINQNNKKALEIKNRGLGEDAEGLANALNVMGAKTKTGDGAYNSENSMLQKIEPSVTANNTVYQQLDVQKLKNEYDGGNAIYDYAKKLVDNKGVYDDSMKDLRLAAEKAGWNSSFGDNGIKMSDDGKSVVIMTQNINKQGLEVKGVNEVYRDSKMIENPGNKK